MNMHKKSFWLGIFVITALIILTVLLLTIGGRGLFASQAKYSMFFDKSVKGLNVGSPLMFRGVRIGQVTDIQLTSHKRAYVNGELSWPIEVIVEIDPESLDIGKDENFSNLSLIDKTTRDSLLMLKSQELVDKWLHYMVKTHGLCAQLQSMSLLTGQLYIELDFFSDYVLSREDLDNLDKQVIPTKISAFERIFLSLQQKEQVDSFHQAIMLIGNFITSGKAQSTLDNFYEVSENTKQLTSDAKKVVTSVKKVSAPVSLSIAGILVKAYEALDNATKLLLTINGEAPQILEATKGTVTSLNAKVNTLSSKMDILLDDMMNVSSTIKKSADLQNGPASKLLSDFQYMTKQINDTFTEAESLIQDMKKCVAPESAERQALQTSIEEIERAARSIRNLADTIERNPESLLRGK